MDRPAPEIDALVEVLRDEHGPDVRLASEPETKSEGFDSAIHLVDLAGESLPPAWRQPLVLRIKSDAARADEAHREQRIHDWLIARGYPAPAMLAVFDPGTLSDRPVQVLARASGPLLLDAVLRRPWSARKALRLLAHLQARLHSLPVDGFPTDGDLLDRRLRLVQVTVERLDDPALRSGLERIESLAPRLRAGPTAVCHGDFHPLNVLADAVTATVIDWTDAGLGDPNGDVARTALLFDMASIVATKPIERMILGAVGPVLGRVYLRLYARQAPLDLERLALWRPVHLLHGWAQAASVGAGDVSPESVDALRQRFVRALAEVSVNPSA